jgi:hypothetical protein
MHSHSLCGLQQVVLLGGKASAGPANVQVLSACLLLGGRGCRSLPALQRGWGRWHYKLWKDVLEPKLVGLELCKLGTCKPLRGSAQQMYICHVATCGMPVYKLCCPSVHVELCRVRSVAACTCTAVCCCCVHLHNHLEGGFSAPALQRCWLQLVVVWVACRLRRVQHAPSLGGCGCALHSCCLQVCMSLEVSGSVFCTAVQCCRHRHHSVNSDCLW